MQILKPSPDLPNQKLFNKPHPSAEDSDAHFGYRIPASADGRNCLQLHSISGDPPRQQNQMVFSHQVGNAVLSQVLSGQEAESSFFSPLPFFSPFALRTTGIHPSDWS